MNKSIFSNKELIIFDMDGCLIDSERYYRKAWMQAFEDYDIEIPLERVQTWTGMGWNLIREDIFDIVKDIGLVDELRLRRERYFFNYLYEGEVKLKDGAIEIIDAFKRSKKIIALATSTFSKKGRQLINHFHLQDYFDYITYGDEVSKTKPSPDIFLKTLDKSSINRSKALIFEDSKNGVLAAYNAGIDCIYIPDIVNQDIPKDYYVLRANSFSELMKEEDFNVE